MAASPARGQLIKKMFFSRFPFEPENLVSRGGFGRSVPRQAAHSPYSGCLFVYSQESSRFPRRRLHIPSTAIGSVPYLSGHASVYRWRSLPRVRIYNLLAYSSVRTSIVPSTPKTWFWDTSVEGFSAGVGINSTSRDAADWLSLRFSRSVETRRRFGWLRMVCTSSELQFGALWEVVARERQGALAEKAW